MFWERRTIFAHKVYNRMDEMYIVFWTRRICSENRLIANVMNGLITRIWIQKVFCWLYEESILLL